MSPTDLERVADWFGAADNRQLVDLFGSTELAIALCHIVLDDEDRPVDYRLVAVNDAFVTETGLYGCTGRLASEVAPNFQRAWAELFAPAALDRSHVRTEILVEATQRWFDVSAVPVGPPGSFALVFREESGRHAALLELRQNQAELRRVLERERDRSRRLQRALLPDALVADDRVALSAYYRAARGDAQAGGDWYDSFRWDDGVVGAVVGDVVGHGIEAAASMGRLRAACAALAPFTAGSPTALLHALGGLASGPNGTDYLTSACVVVDAARERIASARCGHPAPLLVLPDRSTRWLDGGNAPPLGRVIGPVERDRHVPMSDPFPPGSMVVLYTDGLIERRGEDMGASMRDFAALVASIAPLDPRNAASQIAEAVVRDDLLDDDVAVVTVHLTENPR